MGRAVSNDLRLRLVRGIASGKSRRCVATQFEVSASTAVRVQARISATGSVESAKQSRPKGLAKLGPFRAILIERVKATPDTTLPALAAWPESEHGVPADPSNHSKFPCSASSTHMNALLAAEKERSDVKAARWTWGKLRQPFMRRNQHLRPLRSLGLLEPPQRRRLHRRAARIIRKGLTRICGHGSRIACAALLIIWPAQVDAETIHIEESRYNTIVIDRKDGRLYLRFGHNSELYTQAVRQLDDPFALPVPYTRYMTLALAYATTTARIAEIGAATGQTSAYLARSLPDSQVTAVELDGAVLKLAKAHFSLPDLPNLSLVERDGRVFLTRTKDRFDVILVDAYRGPFVPFHLSTQEFYETAFNRLASGGVLALNIEPSTMLFVPTLVTLASVFANIDLYAASANVVAIAYDGAEISDAELQSRATALDARHGLRYGLSPMLVDRQRFVRPIDDQEILTDDFAPVEFLRAVRRHNSGPPAVTPVE